MSSAWTPAAVSPSTSSAEASSGWDRLPRRTTVRICRDGAGSPRKGTRVVAYPAGIRASRGTSDTPNPAATKAAPVSHSTASCATVGVKPASAHEVKTNWRCGRFGRSTIHDSSAVSRRVIQARCANGCPSGTSRSRGSSRRNCWSKRPSAVAGTVSVATITARSASSASRRSKHSNGSASMIRTSSSGRHERRAVTTGGKRAAAAVEKPQSLNSPACSPDSEVISALMVSQRAKRSSAWLRRIRAAGVRRTPRPWGISSTTPRSSANPLN